MGVLFHFACFWGGFSSLRFSPLYFFLGGGWGGVSLVCLLLSVLVVWGPDVWGKSYVQILLHMSRRLNIRLLEPLEKHPVVIDTL